MKSLSQRIVFFFFLGAWQAILLGSWLGRDTRPPSWDASVHLIQAQHYERAISQGNMSQLWHPLPTPGHPPYPPLPHLVMACGLWLGETTGFPLEDSATFMQWVFLLLLAVGSYAVAQGLWGGLAGPVAAVTVSLARPVIVYAHFPLADVALVAWVFCAYGAWLASERYTRLMPSLLLGLTVAGGGLTKWTFPLYILPLLGDALWQFVRRRESRSPVLLAGGLAVLLAGPWYAANLLTLLPKLARASSLGQQEGDPTGFTWAAFLYYFRQAPALFSPWMFVLGLASGVWAAVFRRGKVFWIGWLFSGYLVVSLLSNKDPRYILPVMAVLPLTLASLPRPAAVGCAALSLVFSALITWGSPQWSFVDAARDEDWKLGEIVAECRTAVDPQDRPVVVTLLANHEYLNGNNMRWGVMSRHWEKWVWPRTKINRLGELSPLVLVKTLDLGSPRSVASATAARTEALQADGWFQRNYSVRREWVLPDGSRALLFEARAKGGVALHSEDAASLARLLGFTSGDFRLTRRGAESILSSTQAWVGGVPLGEVRLRLPPVHAARDETGSLRVFGLGAVVVEHVGIFASSLEGALFQRIKGLDSLRVSLQEDGDFQCALSWHGLPVALSGRVGIKPQLRASRVVLDQVRFKVAGVPVPFVPQTWEFALEKGQGLAYSIRIAELKGLEGVWVLGS